MLKNTVSKEQLIAFQNVQLPILLKQGESRKDILSQQMY